MRLLSEANILWESIRRSNTLKDGRINERQLKRSLQLFAACTPNLTRVVLINHPFDLPENVRKPGWTGTELARYEREGSRILPEHLIAIRRTLEIAGVEFSEGPPYVRLAK